MAGTFSQDHPALILNFKSLAFNPLSWPGTLHHLFWGFVITESTCRVLQHFKLSVDKNQNNYNFHKLKAAAPPNTDFSPQVSATVRRCFVLAAALGSMGSQKDHDHQVSSHPSTPLHVTTQLCQGCSASPSPRLGEALLNATIGGTVPEAAANAFCQQRSRSERWW